MSDTQPGGGLAFKDIFMMACSAAGLAALIASPIVGYGGLKEKLDINAQRITKLEAADAAKTEVLTKIDGRTIRIETKLEMIVPSKAAVQP